MKPTSAIFQGSELSTILHIHFGKRINLARCKLMSLFIHGLCKLRTVSFEKLAIGFDSGAKPCSSLRRVQRFFSGFTLDSDMVALLIFALLPEKENLCLTIDRTNWKFGQTDINIFMLGIAHQGVSIPLLFTLLPKRGNSNCSERIALVQRFVSLFGKGCINYLVADREFVGADWIGFLNSEGIRYHIRIRNNFWVLLPHSQKKVRASWLFNNLGMGEYREHRRIASLGGQLCYLSGCKLPKGEYLIIVSFNRPEEAKERYALRWQIEMCFKAMKSSGFDLEKTHLQHLERIEKLLLFIMIAFVWCHKIGVYLHENVRPIKVKKHGRREKSVFRIGLDHLANLLLNPQNKDIIGIYRFLSCT